jgi:hypothetical protein
MELSNLVRFRGSFGGAWGGLGGGVLALSVLLLGASGCHNGAAGGRHSDAAVDNAPEVSQHLPPPDANCPADAAGGGPCPINFCGTPQAVSVLVAGQTAQLGADAICTPGYVCIPDGPTAAGNALQLRCVQPFAPATAFGAACATTGATSRCKSDALCIESADVPGQPFCSALCRADADCEAGAYCLEHKTTVPGSYVNLGYCTPRSKISATVCTREADCPAAQGCVAYGARSNLTVCKVGGAKSMGAACTAPAECRSGQCFDREFHAGVNRSFCSGACSKSSDCGADQRCARIVLDANGTPADPRDDLVVGLCQSLFVSVAAAGCQADADCTTGETCSTKYGLCYTTGVATGAPCAIDQDCALGAVCTTTFRGGYCQTFGCAPGAAAGGVDSCPGTNSTCAQRGGDVPLSTCYEGCRQSGDCSRFKDNYVCEMPDGTPSVGTSAGDAGAGDAGSDADASDAAGEGGADAGATPLSLCLYNQGV